MPELPNQGQSRPLPKVRLDLRRLYFSARGRIRRSTWQPMAVVLALVGLILCLIPYAAFALPALLIPLVFLNAKRLHDMGANVHTQTVVLIFAALAPAAALLLTGLPQLEHVRLEAFKPTAHMIVIEAPDASRYVWLWVLHMTQAQETALRAAAWFEAALWLLFLAWIAFAPSRPGDTPHGPKPRTLEVTLPEDIQARRGP